MMTKIDIATAYIHLKKVSTVYYLEALFLF